VCVCVWVFVCVVCVVAVRVVVQVFISAVCRVLYRSVCVGTGGCAHLAVGGVCAAGVRGGGLRFWGLCVFVIEYLRRLWVFSVVAR